MDHMQEALVFEAELSAANIRWEAAEQLKRPSTIFRPHLSIDGDQWCVLYGEDLQDGVAGFGDSPAEAMAAFDKAWDTRLTTTQKGNRDECP